LSLADVELRVRAAVQRGVALSVVDRFADDLDAADLPRVRREPQADRAGAAISVDDGFAAGERRRFLDRAVQLHRLLGVQLEERAGREGEAQLAEIRLKGGLAPETNRAVAEDERRLAGIHIDGDR